EGGRLGPDRADRLGLGEAAVARARPLQHRSSRPLGMGQDCRPGPGRGRRHLEPRLPRPPPHRPDARALRRGGHAAGDGRPGRLRLGRHLPVQPAGGLHDGHDARGRRRRHPRPL
ncbi:MAG: 3-oxoacyl-[acyl-carrier protein] reductase, partial [uncultured Acidimicrobiales bacterium]